MWSCVKLTHSLYVNRCTSSVEAYPNKMQNCIKIRNKSLMILDMNLHDDDKTYKNFVALNYCVRHKMVYFYKCNPFPLKEFWLVKRS